jgi:plastocyanin
MTVNIVDTKGGSFAFSPRTLTIPPGTLVIWRNETQVQHTVTGGPLNSGFINPGATFSFRFTSAGTINYHCTIHPFMTATIIVT